MGMIKSLFVVLVVLALIGGAIEFQSNDKDWSLVVNKETAFNSIQNGSVKIYNFFADVVSSANTVTDSDLAVEKSR